MKTKSDTNVWKFFAAVYLVTALLVTPILLSGDGLSPLNTVLMAAITFIPSITGVIFIYRTRGAADQRDFWQRVLRWPRAHTKTAVVGLLVLPLSVCISFGLASWFSVGSINLDYSLRVLTDWKTLLVFLFVELTFGALSEELGWRGYALDELQSRWNALTSSLVLGFIWALWHTPAFLIPGTSQYAMGGLFSWTYVTFLLMVTFGSVIHTWVYNNTGRSILVAGVLMHFVQNATLIFLGGIFEEFSMPPVYWPIMLAVTAAIAGTLVLLGGPHTLRRQYA